MRVVAIELRALGTKLTRQEMAEAQRHTGELFIQAETAYLCGQTHPSEWPTHGHVLPPLYNASVRRLSGTSLVIVGHYQRDGVRLLTTLPQAWWCQLP